MQIDVPDEIAARLDLLAKQENRTVAEVLKTLLQRYAPSHTTLAEMAQNAQDAGLASEDEVDTAKNSRDILNSEYADYLK